MLAKHLIIFGAISLNFFAAGAAHAQMSMPMTSPMGVDLMIESEDAKDPKWIEKTFGQQSQQQKATPYQQQAGTLSFTSSPQRRKANYKEFIQRSKTYSPEGAAQWERLIASGVDPIQQSNSGLQRIYGYQSNNIADAYSIWLASVWMAVYDPDAELNRTQFEGIRNRVRMAFSQDATLMQASDAMKQQFSENLLMNAIIIDGTIKETKSDPNMRKQLQASILKNVKQNMSVDLSTLTLTDQGFVPRKSGKRGDAGEAIEGAEPGTQGSGAMASAAPSPSNSGMDGADIALLIAAVSAGAGGIFMIGKGISNQRQG
jgi:hypothetical protein